MAGAEGGSRKPRGSGGPISRPICGGRWGRMPSLRGRWRAIPMQLVEVHHARRCLSGRSPRRVPVGGHAHESYRAKRTIAGQAVLARPSAPMLRPEGGEARAVGYHVGTLRHSRARVWGTVKSRWRCRQAVRRCERDCPPPITSDTGLVSWPGRCGGWTAFFIHGAQQGPRPSASRSASRVQLIGDDI